MVKKISLIGVAILGMIGAVRAEDGGWKSTSITFSHRRLESGTVEIDWHTEKSECTAREASEKLARRQFLMNVGKIARRTLHYKEATEIVTAQK